MAQLSKTAFLSKWATLFADNTSGDISEQDVRDFRQDISDSFLSISDNFIDEDSFATNSATQVPSQQSVKAYVDAAALGLVTSWKAPVVNATTANITLSGEQTIDGVLTSASRILVKNQSTQSENGIYVTAAGAWARSSDANIAAELEGAAVTVQQGSTNANTTWIQTTDGITLGSSNIVWSQLGTSVPAADGTTAGIAKLYNNVSGTNTDGAPDQSSVNTALALKAPLASPTFTGTPAAPTAAGGTNTTQLATTAFVQSAVANSKTLVIACSDEVTPITATTGKVTFRMPFAMTLSGVRASLTTEQTSGSIFTVDINEGPSSILSTKLTIDNGQKTSTTATTPAVISDSSLADDAEITIDVDQIGDTTAKGLKVTLIGS